MNAAKVWAELQQMFGQRFITEFGNEPTPSWEEGLAEFPWNAIKRGVGRLLKSGSTHPPSLPLFLAMVRNEHQPPPTVIPEPPPRLQGYESWSVGLLVQYSWWRISHGRAFGAERSRDLFHDARELGAWFQAFVDAGDVNATRALFLEKFLERFVDAGDRDAVRTIEQHRVAQTVQTSARKRRA